MTRSPRDEVRPLAVTNLNGWIDQLRYNPCGTPASRFWRPHAIHLNF